MLRILSLMLSLAGSAAAAQQADPSPPTEVDLELVLLVDVSRSMSELELDIQRQGYAAALRSDEVFTAIQGGLLQNVALTYMEWAGTQRTVVDWTLIDSRSALDAFATAIERNMSYGMRRTSISEALIFAANEIASNPYAGLRRVIDVSGDGPNNQGRNVTRARDEVTAQGVVINGLPLMTRDGENDRWNVENLDAYYEACVIGGPGAFLVPVYDWTDFPEAVRRKLVLEIAAAPPEPVAEPATAQTLLHRIQYSAPPEVDCEIGEKIWAQRRAIWADP